MGENSFESRQLGYWGVRYPWWGWGRYPRASTPGGKLSKGEDILLYPASTLTLARWLGACFKAVVPVRATCFHILLARRATAAMFRSTSGWTSSEDDDVTYNSTTANST